MSLNVSLRSPYKLEVVKVFAFFSQSFPQFSNKQALTTQPSRQPPRTLLIASSGRALPKAQTKGWRRRNR